MLLVFSDAGRNYGNAILTVNRSCAMAMQFNVDTRLPVANAISP